MAKTALKGTPVHTNADLPTVGSVAPDGVLVTSALQTVQLESFEGTRVLNIFPSVDTGICAMSVRAFNEKAGAMDGVTVLNISADLPFAHSRFCGAEGLEGVVSLSTFRGDFAKDYGVAMLDGPLAGLCARAVIVLDGDGTVVYTQLVDEITTEPDYDSALAAAQG